jgi:hypothetical protein
MATDDEPDPLTGYLDTVLTAMLAEIGRALVRRAGLRSCHCLCRYRHPAETGVCDSEAVTTREFVSDELGSVHVPMCAPCIVAQGVAEGIPGAR